MDPNLESQRAFYDAMYRSRSAARNIDELCRLNAIRSFLRRLGFIHGRILELGCGTGWLSAELSRHGSVTAVDWSTEAIRVARERHPGIQFHAANFLEDPLPEAGYDLVVSSEVLEHLATQDQRRFVELASRQLTAGGYLIVTTPNKPVAQRLGSHAHDLQPVENWLTAADLRALLEPSFRILTIRTALFFQPFFRRHPFVAWLRYLFYCRLRGLAVTENLLQHAPYGTYLCCLAQRSG